MLLNDEKLKGLEELLAVPTAVATLRQMLGAANAPEVRVQAAKGLMDIWNNVVDDEEKQSRLIQHSIAIVSAEPGGESEQLVDQLIHQVMGNDNENLDSTDGDLQETAAAMRGAAKTTAFAGAQARMAPPKAAPAKSAPAAPAKAAPTSPAAPGRNGTQEKTPPAAKTKPKQGDDEESALAKVPTKYWVILGSLAVVLVLTWWWSWSGAPESSSSLVNRALSGGTPEDRAKAAAELASHPKEALPLVRRLAKESSEAGVLVPALSALTRFGDKDSAELFFAGMGHKDPLVRDVSFKGLGNVLNLPFDKRDEFKANDPETTRTEVIARLRKEYPPGPAKGP